MKWLMRLFWGLLFAAIVVGAVISFQPKPVAIDTANVTRGAMEVTVDEDGKTRIKEKYIVSTPVSGRLHRIGFREGDPVTAGETILASIQPGNPDLLDARSLAQAKARVAAADASVARSKSRAERAKVDKEHAWREFARVNELFKKNAISRSELETKEAQFRSLTELHRSAQFDRDISLYELDLAKAALVHVQPESENSSPETVPAEFFLIRSPIKGVVLRVLQESSTIVSPGTPIVELGDPEDLEIVVDVLSTDAVKISIGTRVHIEQWGGDVTLEGIVRLVEPSAFEKYSALGVEEQRVNVIVDFEEPEANVGELGDGYRVEARMVTWSSDEVLRVPTSALFREKNEWAVFVVESNIARLKTVSLGARNDEMAEVLTGLDENQEVILHPGDTLADGVEIVLRAAE